MQDRKDKNLSPTWKSKVGALEDQVGAVTKVSSQEKSTDPRGNLPWDHEGKAGGLGPGVSAPIG